MNDPVGEIPVLITADFSDLSDGIKQAEGLATAGAQQISSAFGTAASASDEWAAALGRSTNATQADIEAIGRATSSYGTLGSAIDQALGTERDMLDVIEQYPKSFTEMTAAQQRAVQSMNEQANASKEAADASKELELSSSSLLTTLLKFAGISLTLGGIKTAITESVEAFAHLQRAEESLTALTGSAETAQTEISKLREIAQDNALSFPSLLKADQQMHAFGFTTAQTNILLVDAANASRATGKEFDTVAATLERVVASGAAGGRQLASLGLTTKDLSGALGVTSSEAGKLFKSLDESARVDIINAALSKFDGLAQQTSNDLIGSWQKLSNTAQLEFEKIGAAIEPAATAFIKFASTEAQAVGSVVQNLLSLGKSTEAAFAAVAVAVAANPMAALGLTLIQTGIAWRSMNDATDLAAKSIKAAADSLDILVIKERQTFAEFPAYTQQLNNLVKEFNNGIKGPDEFRNALIKLAEQFRIDHPIHQQATTDAKNLADQIADLKAKLDAGIITKTQYTEELKKLTAAHQDASAATKGHVLSLEDLTAKEATANAEVHRALDVYSQVIALYKDMPDKVGLVSAAHDQLTKALKAAHESFSSLSVTIIQGLKDQGTAYENWKNGFGAAALDIINKQKDLQKAANDAATAFNQIAAAAKTNVDAYNALSPAASALEKALKAADMTAADLNTTLHLIGNDGIPVITGGTTKLVDATGKFDQVISDVNSKLREMGVTGDNTMQVIKGGTTQNIELMTGYKNSVDAAVGSIIVMHPKLLDADAAHRQLNNTASQLPPIVEQAARAFDDVDAAILRDINDASSLSSTLKSVADSLGSASSGGGGESGGGGGGGFGGHFGSFDLFDPAHPERGGWVFKQGYGTGIGTGGIVATYVEPQTLTPPSRGGGGGVSFGGSSAPISVPAVTTPVVQTAADVLKQIQDEVSSGAIDLLHLTSGQVQDFIKLMTDAGVSLDDAIKAMGGTASTTTNQISTSGTAVANAFSVLQDSASQLSSTAQIAGPALEGAVMSFTTLNTVVAATTDQLQAYGKSISDLQAQIDAVNQKNAQDAAAAYAANPNQRFFGQAPIFIDPSLLTPPSAPGPHGLINPGAPGTGVPMNVTINNPVVRSQSDIDNLAKTLRNLGMT